MGLKGKTAVNRLRSPLYQPCISQLSASDEGFEFRYPRALAPVVSAGITRIFRIVGKDEKTSLCTWG